MISTTTYSVPDADVATMKANDSKPYDQSIRDTSVKLFMELMAFSAAADYSRVAVLKIGDRIDDHVYTYNGQSAKFHDVSHRQVANAVDFHHYIDRMMLNYYKYLLDTVSQYNTPTGPLFDQGVTITRTSARRAPTRSATSRGSRPGPPTATSRKGSTSWSAPARNRAAARTARAATRRFRASTRCSTRC